jgi:hypothetical protein
MKPRVRQWLAAGALCAITLAAYANSFQSGFVLDNFALLHGDDRIHTATLQNLALILNHTYWWPIWESGLYRPVTTLSYLLNYAILGNIDRPAGYHWINLLLHAGNVLLVFALARRLLRDFRPSFLIAAVWAVHPVLTESVTNIVGRADLLAGMTTLGGLLIYLRSTETTGSRRLAWLAGLMAVTAVGVFSKESAVAVLGVIALYELTWRNPKRLRGFLLACLAMSPAFLAMWLVRSRVLSASAAPDFLFVDNPIVGADFWTGRLTAIKVMGKYLGLLVWPAHLSADYSYRQIPLADGSLTDWIAWIVVAAAALGVPFLYRRNKPAFFAATFAFVTLLPASNLVFPVGTIMAERLLYLPAIGFAVCLILALDAIGRRTRSGLAAPLALGLLITAALGARTFERNKDWRDGFTFWSAAVQTSPLSYKTHAGLAVEMLQAEHVDVVQAQSEDELGLAVLDSLPDQLNLPALYLRAGTHDVRIGDGFRLQDADGKMLTPPESVAAYEKARMLLLRGLSILQAQHLQAQHQADREKKPGSGDEPGVPKLISADADISAYLVLSQVAERLGKTGETLHWAREAQLTGPMSPAAYLRIHDLLLAAGERDDAMAALMEGLLLTSDAAILRKLVAEHADDPDGGKCAISYAEAVPQIDFSCAPVRKQLCSVSGEVVRMGLKAGGRDFAERMRHEFTAKYACPQSSDKPVSADPLQ